MGTLRHNILLCKNTIYFHRRRVYYNTLALGAYSSFCMQVSKSESEVLRMGVAGSLAHGSVEALFHFVDTVNIKSKAIKTSPTAYRMIHNIYATEGVIGFGRGIGAAVYGNYTSGFLYFTLYKFFKTTLPELGGYRAFVSAFIAEIAAILYQFPFDLIKCRIQAVNYSFKYSSWQHGMQKEFTCNGVRGLYTGLPPYLLTYSIFAAMQFSIYEKVLCRFKRSMPQQEYERREF
jgi:hypothetical protein